MIFRLVLISAALWGSATSMKLDSSLGRELLSRTRNVEQEEEVDYSWIMDYSMKFTSCHTITQYGAVDGDEADGNGGTWKQTLVEYRLCSSDECGYGCKGGEYLVNMIDFVDLYTEARLTAEELACETTRENCYCDDVDDEDGCQAQCYVDAELDYCVEGDDDAEAFNIQEYLECQLLENQNGGQYYAQEYYVGLSCSENGQRVNLAVFTDAYCTVPGPNNIYASYIGETLPYADESIVAENCVGCSQSNGDDDAGNEVSEFCMTSYEAAVKCESKLNIYNPITNGCDYLHNLYLREDNYNPVGHTKTLVAAWVFFVSTIVLAVVAGRLHKKANQKINLNGDNMGAVV